MSEQLSVSLFGYNRKQVERILNDHSKQLEDIKSEKEALEEKVKKLEEELTYYKDLEETLQASIVDARLTGERVIEESNREAEQLVDRTNQAIAQYKEEFAYQSRELMSNGKELKTQLSDMKEKFLDVLDEYRAYVEETDFDSYYPEKEMRRFAKQMDVYEEEAVEAFRLQQEEAGSWSDQNLSREEKDRFKQLIDEVTGLDDKEEDDDESSKSNVAGKIAELKLING